LVGNSAFIPQIEGMDRFA